MKLDGEAGTVGCLYEEKFDIPVMLAMLECCIFEILPKKDSKKWRLEFFNSIKVGSDQSTTGWKFLYWLVTEELTQYKISKELLRRIAEVIKPATMGLSIDFIAARIVYGGAARIVDDGAKSPADYAAASAASAAAANSDSIAAEAVADEALRVFDKSIGKNVLE